MRGIAVVLLRSLLPLVALLLGGWPLLVRRFDRNTGGRDFDDLADGPARPSEPAFRRVTPERQPARDSAPAAAGAEAIPPVSPRSSGSGEPEPTGEQPPADWMEELRRSMRRPEAQAELVSAPRAARRSARGGRRVRVGRDVAITAGLLGVAAIVGLGLTVFVIGGGGESPSAPPNQGLASAEGSFPAGGSPSASPSEAPTATPEPATPSPSPTAIAPVPQVALAESQANGVPHVEVSWDEVPDATGYELAYDAGDGEWQPADLSSETATSATIEVVADETYRFRSRAETPGGTSAWAVSPSVRLTIVEEDDASVEFDGFWDRAIHESYIGDDARFTTIGGTSVRFTFAGAGVAWRGPLGPGRGRAEVFLDGESVGRIDQGSTTFVPRNVLYATSWPEPEEHELRIVVEGTAGRPTVSVDAFYVLELAAE